MPCQGLKIKINFWQLIGLFWPQWPPKSKIVTLKRPAPLHCGCPRFSHFHVLLLQKSRLGEKRRVHWVELISEVEAFYFLEPVFSQVYQDGNYLYLGQYSQTICRFQYVMIPSLGWEHYSVHSWKAGPDCGKLLL